MKKHTLVLCAIMALLLVAGCTAQPTTVTDMNGFIYSTAGKQITITEYKGNATIAILPEVYNDNPVVGLAGGALKGCTITDITLPSSITSVTADAFIGSNVKSISIRGLSAKFAAKDGILYDFKMHELVAYPPMMENSDLHIENGINTVKEGAFQENAFLQSVVFDGTRIEPRAFFKAKSLKRVELTNAVKLERLAFASSALEEIILPETLDFIDQTALADCANLKRITVKKDSYAHSWCIENGFEGITVTE